MTRSPYIVLGMPRSGTAWLSAFLSAPGFPPCEHEPSRFWTSRADLWAFLDRQDGAGISDATLTWFWRDILAFRPDARIVVAWRPSADVRESARRAGIPLSESDGLEAMSVEALRAVGSGPTILALDFADIRKPAVVREVFRHCHGMASPRGWAEIMIARNIQVPWQPRFAEGFGNRDGFARFMAERGAPVPRTGARQ